MKHLELHILQSVPVSCLNRDDLNSPKTAYFGGVQRARVSSQCWKRAVRESAKELMPDRFGGVRTRLILEPLREELRKAGLTKEEDLAKALEEMVEALNNKIEGDRVKTLVFLSPSELARAAREYVANKGKDKVAEKAWKAAVAESLRDAVDIALFGRMVADNADLTVEGAAMFSHAISTHRVSNEIDFYTAVDEWKRENRDMDIGAGMMGTLEFASATFYRFVALNLDLLADGDHLGSLGLEERKRAVRVFVQSVLMAMPKARKNAMNANTLPGYAMAVVRDKGHPVQLVNAFEKPVRAGEKGLLQSSVEAMKEEYERLKRTWGLDERLCVAIPDHTLEQFLDKVVEHVS